jgi:hypothetical protein
MTTFVSHLVQRIRQNHAVEHATITLLMQHQRNLPMVAGRSNQRGFYVFGRVETAALTAAAVEALARLQRGDAYLAIHPNCGTNLVAMSTLTGAATLLTTTIGRRQKAGPLDQIPMVILAAATGILVGRPLGMQLQRRVTTLADVRNLRLGAINRWQAMGGRWIQHFVHLEEVT